MLKRLLHYRNYRFFILVFAFQGRGRVTQDLVGLSMFHYLRDGRVEPEACMRPMILWLSLAVTRGLFGFSLDAGIHWDLQHIPESGKVNFAAFGRSTIRSLWP